MVLKTSDNGASAAQRLNRVLEFLGRAKSDLPAGLDLDAFTGRRIAAHAGLVGFDREDTEPAHADPRTLLQMRGYRGHEVSQQSVGLLLRQGVRLPELLEYGLQRDHGRGGGLVL